jgi:hypothetical protein
MDKALIRKDDDTSVRLQCSTPVLEPLPIDIFCGREESHKKFGKSNLSTVVGGEIVEI